MNDAFIAQLLTIDKDDDMKRIHDDMDGVPKGVGLVLADAADDEENETGGDGSPQVRSIAIPRWLSTPQVRKYLVGTGGEGLKALEDEYECVVVITGHGSNCKDPNLPGYHLPHLLVTMTGTDVRNLGRLRQKIENKLIEYVIDNSPKRVVVGDNGDKVVGPPPSLGRLLYSLGISAADASPRTKDKQPDRTVLVRSPKASSLYDRRRNDDGTMPEFETRKVWMNVCELPQDSTTLEYHGRFLASKSLRSYYRTTFNCKVDVYGVWEGEDGQSGDIEGLMCAPYVLVTSTDDKSSVDKCLMHVEHRIREHEEKYDVSRAGGRRVLRGEKRQKPQPMES